MKSQFTYYSLALITILVAVLGLSILIADRNGLRIYGSPRLIPVTLKNPIVIESIEVPNTLVLSDGSKRTLEGVVFKQPLNLRTTPAIVAQWADLYITGPELIDADSRVAKIWYLARPTTRRNLKAGEGFEAELSAVSEGVVRGRMLRQKHYWCGNSFFARTFPQDLPSATEIDLGEAFVRAGIAEPQTKDQKYAERLERAQSYGLSMFD